MRTAQKIAAQTEDGPSVKSPKASGKGGGGRKNPRSLANLASPWKRGESGNPGGRPKNDVASEIAQAVFTENPELIYNAFIKALKGGNAYAFQVLADRGFGKLKDKLEVSGFEGMADAIARARKRAANR